MAGQGPGPPGRRRRRHHFQGRRTGRRGDPVGLETLSERKKMSDNKDKQRSEADAELEREIRKGRKFTLAEAIGRMAGPGAMKGVSPVTRMQQAAVEIEDWLRLHMSAGDGELQTVMFRRIKGSELLLHNFEQPLFVLASCCQQLLDSDRLLQELVREADEEWGRVQGERPYFEQEESPPHPDDPYTFESVRKTLAGLIEQLPRASEQ
jgi:hypothetical protein